MQTISKLDKYRNKIDVIDITLVKLLAKRMRVVKRIGKYKIRENIQALDSDRWGKVLARVKDTALKTGELEAQFVEDLWNRIHDEALKQENNIKK